MRRTIKVSIERRKSLCYLVHVHHPLNHVGLSGVLNSLSLPPDGGEGNVGGEEEEETEESEERDDDGGEVKSGVGGVRGSRVGGVRGSVGLSRGSVSVRLRGSVGIISPNSGSGGDGGEENCSSAVSEHGVYVSGYSGVLVGSAWWRQ